MTIEEIRKTHKELHGRRHVQKQVLVERLEMGWSIEETINKDNGAGTEKCVLRRFGRGKITKQYKASMKLDANDSATIGVSEKYGSLEL